MIEKIKTFFMFHKTSIILASASIFVIVTFIVFSYIVYKSREVTKEVEDEKESSIVSVVEKEKDEEKNVNTIYIDIKGAVNKEGVYELNEGSRVVDAINAAGGLKKNANTRFINLSKLLVNEMVIVIYTNEEIEYAKESSSPEIPCVCEVINDSCINNDEDKKEENTLININTAGIEELTTLSGIGDVKAQAIISYRESSGAFEKIEDIMNVDGISESTFSKIKNFITTK